MVDISEQAGAGLPFLLENIMAVSIARPGLEQRIQEIVTPSLEAMGYGLVRVRYTYQAPAEPSRRDRRLKRAVVQPSGQLQLMFERIDGQLFDIDDCSKIHRHVSVLLDVADPIEHGFQLEVSSAGVMRPLTKNSDFKDYIEHRIEVILSQNLDGRRRFKGLLLSADDEKINLLQDDEQRCTLPLDKVADARLLMS